MEDAQQERSPNCARSTASCQAEGRKCGVAQSEGRLPEQAPAGGHAARAAHAEGLAGSPPAHFVCEGEGAQPGVAVQLGGADRHAHKCRCGRGEGGRRGVPRWRAGHGYGVASLAGSLEQAARPGAGGQGQRSVRLRHGHGKACEPRLAPAMALWGPRVPGWRRGGVLGRWREWHRVVLVLRGYGGRRGGLCWQAIWGAGRG